MTSKLVEQAQKIFEVELDKDAKTVYKRLVKVVTDYDAKQKSAKLPSSDKG